MKNRIIPYNSELKEYARYLRNNSTLSEVLLWNKIKKKALGVEFIKHPPAPPSKGESGNIHCLGKALKETMYLKTELKV